VAATELVGELFGREVALEHTMRRPVVQDALLHLLGPDVGMDLRVDDDELRRHPPALDQEPPTLLRDEVPVEVTRENAIEGGIAERQRERVGTNERMCVSRAGRREHPGARIDPHHPAAEMLREEARPASHVHRAGRRQRRHGLDHRADVLAPPGTISFREESGSQVPVVVLGRAALVVRLHRAVEGMPNHRPAV
jgi:hypothetical protein